jgi:hypothetical protein
MKTEIGTNLRIPEVHDDILYFEYVRLPRLVTRYV